LAQRLVSSAQEKHKRTTVVMQMLIGFALSQCNEIATLKRMKQMKKIEPDYSDGIIFFFFVCGLLIIGSGIYLHFHKGYAVGISNGGRGAPRAGTPVYLSGVMVITIGVVIILLPAYTYIKRIIRKLL
jgi:hypothetical protein